MTIEGIADGRKNLHPLQSGLCRAERLSGGLFASGPDLLSGWNVGREPHRAWPSYVTEI